MVIDAGRIKHLGDLMHKSIASNGSAVSSNWRLSADGLTNVVWTPETSGGGVSYGSNSNEVSYANAPGASTLVSRTDHVHRGVTSISHTSNTLFGPITLTPEGQVGITVVGQTIKLNVAGAAGGGGGGSSPARIGASAFHNTTQSLTNNTFTALSLNSEDAGEPDTDAFHDTSTNNSRMTVPSGKAGLYLIDGVIEFATNATGERVLALRVNGTTYIAAHSTMAISTASTPTRMSISKKWVLAVGDYVEMMANQQSGGSLNSTNTSYAPRLSLALLST